MSNEEHDNEHEKEQEETLINAKTGFTFGSVASAAFGLIVGIGSITAKVVTGDVLGVAEDVGAILNVISKSSGLSPIINDASKYLKEKLGESKVLNFAGKAWDVITSRPVKMGLKIGFTVVALMAGLANPFTVVPASIGVAAMLASTTLGSRNIGRNRRILEETKALNESTNGIGGLEKSKSAALDYLLQNKLTKNKVHEVNRAKVGASVARGSILESAAVIVEAVGDSGNFIGVAAAGVSIFGGLAGEADEAIERQEKRNQLLADREEARAKAVCAILATEPGIDKLTPLALDEKYNEVYKANFEKNTITKFINFFKDAWSGKKEYIFGGLKKVFAKNADKADEVKPYAEQQTIEVHKDLSKERTVDSLSKLYRQIPTHIEVEVKNDDVLPSPKIASHSNDHVLNPNYMKTHTHIDKNEHRPHISEGGSVKLAPKVKSR